jgi:hypothetical protein
MPKTPDIHIPEEKRLLDELDRNARAYGFEIGRGHPLTEKLTHISDDNPFMTRDWRDNIIKAPKETDGN